MSDKIGTKLTSVGGIHIVFVTEMDNLIKGGLGGIGSMAGDHEETGRRGLLGEGEASWLCSCVAGRLATGCWFVGALERRASGRRDNEVIG